MYPCPHCNRGPYASKTSLDRHVAKYHAGPDSIGTDQAGDDPDPAPISAAPAAVEAETITIKAPIADLPEYYCIDCGHAPIKKGAIVCPGCGSGLDWTAANG